MLIYLNGRYAYGNFFKNTYYMYNIDYVSAHCSVCACTIQCVHNYIYYTDKSLCCIVKVQYDTSEEQLLIYVLLICWQSGTLFFSFRTRYKMSTKWLILWLFCLYMHVYQCISGTGTPQSSLTPCSTFTSTWKKYHNFPEVTRIGASLRQSLTQNYRAVNPLKPWVPSSTRFSWNGRHESGENCLNEVCLS